MLVALLWGFEANRRRRAGARRFQEKQNLLNTMQVPLMVVDPNTDEVVFGNQAAENLGVLPGSRIGDRVGPDPRARAHYERMQVASPEPRRAYGVPLRVRGEDGQEEERYAIVRSVAVTAPIEALHADERHRLGILFLVEPDADLALLTEDLVGETRQDERRKLAGLLTHGVDTLIRVLAHSLAVRRAGGRPRAPELVSWLAAYVDRRLRTTAWLLDHWDAEPPLPPDSSIEAAAGAGHDRAACRASSPWRRATPTCAPACTGTTACSRSAPTREAPVFTVEIDWPGGVLVHLPGARRLRLLPGRGADQRHPPWPAGLDARRCASALDRVRRELPSRSRTTLRAGAAADERRRGLWRPSILRAARPPLRVAGPGVREAASETYLVSWRVPVSERGDPRRAD